MSAVFLTAALLLLAAVGPLTTSAYGDAWLIAPVR